MAVAPRPSRLADVLVERTTSVGLGLGAVVLVVAALAGAGAGERRPSRPTPLVPAVGSPTNVRGGQADSEDPFAFTTRRRPEFERRAAEGFSHALYVRSPGGVVATAQRVARLRGLVESAARRAGVEPDLLEGLVFLESAGRTDAIAGDLSGAVGPTQILASTARDLLGMRVDLGASRRIGAQLARARRRGRARVVTQLLRRRAQVDQRFSPAAALAGTARYLTLARRRFGREDLAFESYHMGIGNLEGALRAYARARSSTPIRSVVRAGDLSYARLYFGSTPLRRAAAYRRLSGLQDESSTYLWRLGAARRIMALYRQSPARLSRLAALQQARASGEEVLHPPGSTAVFANPREILKARVSGQLAGLPDGLERLGVRVDPGMGELARRLHQPRATYRALRPAALALLVYLAEGVRSIAGTRTPLTLTSTVRDTTYQARLIERNVQAARSYSLHTTGFTFDLLRHYANRRQGPALAFVLDRLQALGLIAWVYEPAAIHVTVSSDARRLIGLLEASGVKLPG